MAEFIFTYAPKGKEYGQDYNGGYTVVHCTDVSKAFDLFHAMHPRKVHHMPSFANWYTEDALKARDLTAEHFGKCHDHIIYAECLGGDK